MKRQDNRYLSSYQTFFAGLGSTNVPTLWWNDGQAYVQLSLEMSAEEILDNVLRIASKESSRVMLIGSLEAFSRYWFLQYGAGMTWTLESYNHESRTGVYRHYEGKRVTLTRSANWVEGSYFPDVIEAYTAAQRSFEKYFGFEFLGSPTMTGLYAIEQSLPKKSDCSHLSDTFAAFLHERTTQGRTESFLPVETSSFHYYDRVFAYAADCKNELPCGQPVWVEGASYEPYQPAFFDVAFSVPLNWDHVGLLPVLTDDGWSWPREGYHYTFIAEPELRLALAQGWKVIILRSWRFEKGKPLENWQKKLVGLRDAALKDGQKAQADVFRKILLFGIGGLYARSFSRERVVDADELAEMNDSEGLTAEPLGNGFRVEARIKRGERFYMPHWTAYIWSYARAALAKKMLSIPFSELIGCNVDAIYSKSLIESGTGVGQFRLKGRDNYIEPRTINTKRELIALRTASELALKGGE